MIKKIFISITAIIITTSAVLAQDNHYSKLPHKPTYKERKEINTLLNEKLNFTQEQEEQIRDNRIAHKKEMSKIINKMQKLHDKIRDVYYSGIPKFQADIKTAPMKAELVLLKQEADKLRLEHRKKFENILTQEQKIKFNELKKEIHANKQKKVSN